MLKINNETKIALLAIAAISLAIWGFKFLKGLNILTTSRTFYVRYDNVDQLRPSSPIFIKGLQVGMVKALNIDKKDDKTIIATLNIDTDVDIPKDAVATIVGLSLMGGKAVELVIPHPCDGKDCAQSGDYLPAASKSFLQSVIGDPSQIDAYTDKLKHGLTTVWDSIADPNDPKGVGRSLIALENSLKNIESVTAKVSRLLDASAQGISATANNTAALTKTLNASSADINTTLANLAALSKQMKDAGLDKTTQKATQAIDSVTTSLAQLRKTLQVTGKTVSRVDTLAQNLVKGKGTAGKVLNDEDLYNNLVRTTRHMELLLQDLRLNPKRYTTVKLKLFGKNKTKDYANPIDDPAYQMLVDSLERAYSKKAKH
jgi:phospholipid/cholesterol/gamma-HCH transport system substrate-binding protein